MTELIEERGLLSEDDYIMIPANVPIIATSRDEWLRSLGTGLICAEVGVAQGGFSKKIMDIVMPMRLYAVDAWGTIVISPELDEKARSDYPIFEEAFKDDLRVHPVKMSSLLASMYIENNKLDMVYIDASHLEYDVLQDLRTWWWKVRPGGYIAGHDFCTTGTWPYGVVPAVFQFLRERPCRLIGMTAFTGEEFPSFVLQKPLLSDAAESYLESTAINIPETISYPLG